MVLEKTEPIMNKTAAFISTLSEVKQRLSELTYEFKERTADYETKFN